MLLSDGPSGMLTQEYNRIGHDLTIEYRPLAVNNPSEQPPPDLSTCVLPLTCHIAHDFDLLDSSYIAPDWVSEDSDAPSSSVGTKATEPHVDYATIADELAHQIESLPPSGPAMR